MTQAGLRWSSAGRSDRGARRKINEDSILVLPDSSIWLVADGMGGHAAGDVASAMVAESVAQARATGPLARRVEVVDEALVAANEAIRQRSLDSFGGRTMGSTVVAMLADEKLGVCLWAGDSRLYRIRDGVLSRISNDHSEVQELMDRGLLSAEEAVNHPHTNVITRAVGGVMVLHLDIRLFEVRAGDTYVLCTDGLYNEVADDEICQFVEPDVEATASRLLAKALERGARDNVSLIVIRAEAP